MPTQWLRDCALAVLFSSFCGSAFGVELVTNGAFEANGGANSNSLNGWTVSDQAGGSGSWYAQTGTAPPGGFGVLLTVAPPPQGSFAAMTSQAGPGSHILSQDITIPAGSPAVFSARVYVNNTATVFATPATLDYNITPNQQFRIDLMTTASPRDDTGAGILQNLYRTNVGDPAVSAYKLITVDVSAFAGQTVRLRIAEADNQGNISSGADVVSIQSGPIAPIAPVPTLSEYGLLLLALLLPAFGAAAVRRSFQR